MTSVPPIEVPIHNGVIRLGQFLKLANFVDDGVAAKHVLTQGYVSVNGEAEERRGRQLTVGDIVTVSGHSAVVTAE